MTNTAEKLTPFAHSSQNRCFGCGPKNPTGLHLDFLLAEDQSVVCLTAVPDTFEGPETYVHGGIIATMLDEAMSKSVRASGVTSVTRQLTVEYLRPVPSGEPIRIEGRLVQKEEKKHWAEARILLDATGKVLAEAKGLFIEVKPR